MKVADKQMERLAHECSMFGANPKSDASHFQVNSRLQSTVNHNVAPCCYALRAIDVLNVHKILINVNKRVYYDKRTNAL